ncbi:type IVB secretion system coupling complex protein DotM/IcmP [Legionella sp. W05-934-2]|jgi:intracellular multiplication protein IcmP|uniref:type IVB secretion system coupling complex protein DotM/IcmP n=1 Tax=Legionella sp. W05-934-2 TaxID=1198649 RepID=UPI0034632752
MAQQQQAQGGGGGDNSMAPVWITILLFFTLYFIWKFGHPYIVSFIFSFNVLQAELVSLVYDPNVLREEIIFMKTTDPATVSWKEFTEYTRDVGIYIRYPVLLVLIALAAVLYRSNIVLKFRKIHNMNTLRSQEQHNWSAIMPVVNEDLVSADIAEGPWAMALTPIEFARKYDLLRKEDKLQDNPLPGLEMTAGIRKGDAKRVFTLQVGPYFTGFDRLPGHIVALAAVFMARINRDKKSASMILSTIDKTYVQGKPDYSVAKPILSKYEKTELVQEVLAKHAYVLSAMASLLEAARADGVVPVCEFLWLKVVDRRLWYMLSSVGRQTPFVEVGGPFAHWKAEKVLGRRSLMPMVDEATKALEMAVKEIKLHPKELSKLEP